MKHGFIRVAAAVPHIRLADCSYNENTINCIEQAEQKEVKLLVFLSFALQGIPADLFFRIYCFCVLWNK